MADDVAAPVPVPAPAPAPASGIGQLFRGIGSAINPWAAPGSAEASFAAARDNPASSPATSTLGQFGSYLSRDIRAQQAAKGPTFGDWLQNIFTGDAKSTADMAEAHKAAVQLRNPTVQQDLINNPERLALAEKDPRAYVASPVFQDFLQRAADNHTATAANTKVETPEEHQRTVDLANKTGVHPDTAHVAVAPQKYSVDDFVNTFKGIPTATFMQLFGAQLQHVQTPQEKAAAELFDRFHGRFADLNQEVKDMEAEDAALAKAGQPKKWDKYVLWGDNPYEAKKKEREKADRAALDALSQFTGVTAKPYPVPGER